MPRRLLLPPDDSSSGFDNNADVLGVSPALLERYLGRPRARSRAGAVGRSRDRAGNRNLPGPRRHVAGPCIARACRSARAVACPFATPSRSTANTSSRSSCSRPRSVPIRGLEYPHQVEVLLDGRPVQLASVGGDADFASRRQSTRRDVVNRRRAADHARAGQGGAAHDSRPRSCKRRLRKVRGACSSFARTTVDTTDHTGLPAHREHHH